MVRCDLRNKAVRDLAWVIGSPCLLQTEAALYVPQRVTDPWCRLSLNDRMPWLKELDAHPEYLNDWLTGEKSALLGLRFERLIEYWLRHWSRTEVYGRNLQVMRAGRAVGEFDFLFHDRQRGQVVHWEVAVKFYLHYRQPDGEDVWLGPNPRDTLHGKLGKVFGHQLRVSHLPETAPLLQHYGIDTVVPEAFIKGWLFYHAAGDWSHPAVIPKGVSPDHLKGWWCTLGEMILPQQDEASRWLPLQRLDWLGTAQSDEAMPGYDRAGVEAWLHDHFARGGKPVLLAELESGADGNWGEVSRGFVVPESWPGLEHRRQCS